MLSRLANQSRPLLLLRCSAVSLRQSSAGLPMKEESFVRTTDSRPVPERFRDPFIGVPRYTEEEIAKWSQNVVCYPAVAPRLPEIDPEVKEQADWDPNQETFEDYIRVWFGKQMPTIYDDLDPQRDTVNFPRPEKKDFADLCRMWFVPDSWFTQFYKQTGVTGPYLFGTAFITFLLSKEMLVIDHENVSGGYFLFLLWFIAYKWGDKIQDWGYRHVDAEGWLWLNWQRAWIETLKKYVENEKTVQANANNHKILFDAKRENVRLQLEAEFRRRQMVAHEEVNRRLNYLVAKKLTEQQFHQTYMVNWVIDSVKKAISPEQDRDYLRQCISDLKTLSTKQKIATI